MSIDGRIDAADRKNSKALSKFENKWGAGAETPKERAQMASAQKSLTATTKANTANAISAGRKQISDQQKAAARKAAIDKARKAGKKYDSITPGFGFDGMQGQPKDPSQQGD